MLLCARDRARMAMRAPALTLGAPGTPHARGAARDASMTDVPDLSRMRRDYETRGLREADLAPTWVEQFDRWFTDAVAAELPEPNAAVVATADTDGAPDARMVLVKGYDASGF